MIMIFACKCVIILFCVIVCPTYGAPYYKHYHLNYPRQFTEHQRIRRQFDLRLSAEHDDKEDETELALEAIANLWRSQDGNTQIEGSAKILHNSNSNSAPTDWRLGINIKLN